jgi:UDP-glucose 4-epimerase
MWATSPKGIEMNILIAGGAGFIGSHLTDALLESGHTVVCVDNLCLGSKNMIKHHFENTQFAFYKQDICNAKKLDEVFAFHKFERIYHLAANSDIQKGGENPSIDIHDTLETTINILNAMHKHGVKELLFASTSAVYGDKREKLQETAGDLRPISYYGGAKLASEAMISAFAAMNAMKVNIIRFPNVVGPRLTHGAIYDFIKKLRKNPKELEILGDGKQEKPYIYSADLLEAMLFLPFETGVNIYNAGVESTTTVRKIADIVCEEMGLKEVEYKFTGGSVGWPGDVPKFQYNLSKIHAAGWKAKHTSSEAVRLATRAAL